MSILETCRRINWSFGRGEVVEISSYDEASGVGTIIITFNRRLGTHDEVRKFKVTNGFVRFWGRRRKLLEFKGRKS